MSQISGRVAIVTGASRGIGQACAVELARRGADVTVNYHTHRQEAEQTAQIVRSYGRRGLVVGCDVGERQQVEDMVQTTVRELGSIDIMVANAAYTVRRPFLELEVEDVAATWATTLWGVFHSCQLAARQMVKQGRGGKICIISSLLAVLPMKNCMPYATAKAGINHMARVIGNELAEHQINVNVLEPGWIDTPGERRFYSEQEIRTLGQMLPLGRLAKPEECAKAVAYLCSDDAAYVTGAKLRLDGGFSFFDWQRRLT